MHLKGDVMQHFRRRPKEKFVGGASVLGGLCGAGATAQILLFLAAARDHLIELLLGLGQFILFGGCLGYLAAYLLSSWFWSATGGSED